MFLLYEAVLAIAFLLAIPYFAFIGFLRGKYFGNFSERFGRYQAARRSHDLWVHAVSVGEVMAAQPVVARVMRERPGTSLVVTTITSTGQQTARRLFPQATTTYLPFDFTASVRRFLDHHDPRLFVLFETEIWPNVLRRTSERGVPMILVNGRLSDNSFPRYRLLSPIVRPLMSLFRHVLTREETDRERFIEIGVPRERTEVSGNVKFDFEPDDAPLDFGEQLAAMVSGRAVFVAGSTTEGEDELLIPLLPQLGDAVFTILAPRKPERFDVVAALLDAADIPYARRTALERSGEARVMLLDSIGELARVYRYASVAFVGGSLLPTVGGHNLIEPAAAGAPVIFGPHVWNFREIVGRFLEQQAVIQVHSPEELIETVQRLIGDDDLRRTYAARAAVVVNANRGAAARTASRVLELLG